ncbi:riboflavin synthase [Dictyobacter formicarum]|uniref:Riboflavin synthase n=1 Tax=Dictyobacter formicarum TaxID=2778368 RepID=A0ABQ3VA72_9CHLR|nr:riboflavin synthase [Dictyobacter formicarum]GHO82777.1 riboflavin synthase subunit alpha [Dictyobacter formicarum]
MFTGIVEEQGILQQCIETGLLISARHILQDVAEKDSIAVDGICLTVTELGTDWFRVDTMPETIRRTRLASLHPGDHLNLERSLLANGRMGGHMVQGHVEACAPILSTREDGIGLDVVIALPHDLRSYIIPKGFVALNGVSLTVVDVWADRFSISLIPYTREHTNLGQAVEGMLLNLETDIVGRYVARFFQSAQFNQ